MAFPAVSCMLLCIRINRCLSSNSSKRLNSTEEAKKLQSKDGIALNQLQNFMKLHSQVSRNEFSTTKNILNSPQPFFAEIR